MTTTADSSTGTGRCEQCEIMMINGIRCHEIGCPLAWRDEIRECPWCGTEFRPEDREQRYCSGSCGYAYNGQPDPDDYRACIECDCSVFVDDWEANGHLCDECKAADEEEEE